MSSMDEMNNSARIVEEWNITMSNYGMRSAVAVLLVFLLLLSGSSSVAAFLPQRSLPIILLKNSIRVPFSSTSISSGSNTNINTNTNTKKNNSLESCIDASLEDGNEVVVLVDANNVRGKSDFKLWNCDLLYKLQLWRCQRQCPSVNVICFVDHGMQPDVFDYNDLGLVVFAGPNRTADDVIAQATRWWAPSLETTTPTPTTNDKPEVHVFVVTSDGELKQRCMRSNQPGRLHRRKKRTSPNVVKVFGSPQLVSCLEALEDENEDSGNNHGHHHKQDNHRGGSQRDEHQRLLERELGELEQEIRGYQSSRPPWNSGQEQLEAKERGPWKSTVLWNEDDSDREEERPPTTKLPFPKKPFSETTWHRVLVAERMRQLMKQLPEQTETTNPLLGRYQSYYQQQQLIDHPSSRAATDTLFLDHRIRCKPYLQQQLFQYLDQAVASVVMSKQKETERIPTATTLWTSPAHSSAAVLRTIVQESPDKTQDQLLARFQNEAPSHLQFSRRQDLRDLLLLVAAKREKRWYLKPESESSSMMDDWCVQPGGGRRSQKRRAAAERSDEREEVVDEALVAVGRKAESRWSERLTPMAKTFQRQSHSQ
jgi:hypothetical protein